MIYLMCNLFLEEGDNPIFANKLLNTLGPSFDSLSMYASFSSHKLEVHFSFYK